MLTTITGESNVYAYFDGSEQSYLRLTRRPAGGKVAEVRLALANEKGFPHEGQLDFVDNRLNAADRRDPPARQLRQRAGPVHAGARARTCGWTARPSTTRCWCPSARSAPTRARSSSTWSAADGKPQFREVKLGALYGGMRVVHGGVKPGENVVVDGLQRVIPGCRSRRRC